MDKCGNQRAIKATGVDEIPREEIERSSLETEPWGIPKFRTGQVRSNQQRRQDQLVR